MIDVKNRKISKKYVKNKKKYRAVERYILFAGTETEKRQNFDMTSTEFRLAKSVIKLVE